MALTTTTTSAAIASTDGVINLTSVSSLVGGMFIKIDEEVMKISLAWTSAANPVPVSRGQNGSAQIAHVSGANATFGNGNDFGNPSATVTTAYPLSGRRRKLISYSASGAIDLPLAGEDIVAVLNGTSILTMTVAAPTKDMDGCMLMIAANGVAAHKISFTGGLSGAGSNYLVATINASAPVVLNVAMAINGLWNAVVSVPLAGTVTNVTATLAST